MSVGSSDRVGAAAGAETLAASFLSTILPSQGVYFIATPFPKGGYKHHPCDSVEEAARLAIELDFQGKTVYFALAGFKAPCVDTPQKDGTTKRQWRTRANIAALRTFCFDLDCGDGKGFESQETAIDALKRFCSTTGLPIPMVVSSGNGLHVYWQLTEDISPESWQPVADKLKALAHKLDFKADPSRTADATSVLRPAGTHHRKDPNNPRPVEVINDDAKPVLFEQFSAAIEASCAQHDVSTPPRSETTNASLNEQFAVKQDFPPCSAQKAANRCPQLARMRDTKGCIPEPAWYASIQLMCHSVEGDELIHEWSNGYVGYSREETDRKISQVRSQGLGPTLCTTFESRNPGGCDGCLFKDKISTPAQLGRAESPKIPALPHAQTPIFVAQPAVEVFKPGTPGVVETGYRFAVTVTPTDSFHSIDYAEALAIVMHAPTEDNVCRLFERRYIGKLNYCKAWGSWLSWDGTRWRPERTDLALDFARSLARDANPSGKANIAKAAFARGVEALARASRDFATEPDQWDRDEFLLNTPGGTVDLRTGALSPHDPNNYITKVTSVTPSAGPKPVFDKFMRDITCEDEELIRYHKQSLGATLSGACNGHWLLFWIGAGRNGKNTLGDSVAESLNDYAKIIPSETLMSVKSQGHPTEIANLRGVRLAISSEVPEGAYWNEARLKSLTGDAMLTGRFMRGDFFEFPRTHKHLIYGNHRPQLRVVDDAIRNRMHIIPFRAVFDEARGNCDPRMPEKLRAESPQILAWLIEGHLQWIKDGFKLIRCPAVQRETSEYLEMQSTPDLWVAERCEAIPNDNRPTKGLETATVLYRDFVVWKQFRGEHAPSQTRWGEWMESKFQRVKSNGVRYRGIRLNPPQRNTTEGFPNNPALTQKFNEE